jgi:type II secretory pathway pseudopilin PulG
VRLNQKGITLVELLAALVLILLVAGIAWTALSIGFKHSAVETNKTNLQQDANLIVASLSREHRSNEKYSLSFDANKQLVIKTCKTIDSCPASAAYTRVIDYNYDYTGTTINGAVYDGGSFTEVVVEPEKKHTVLMLKLKLSNNTVTVNTTLTRIITGMK